MVVLSDHALFLPKAVGQRKNCVLNSKFPHQRQCPQRHWCQMETGSVFLLYCIFLVRLQITVLWVCLLLCNFPFWNAGLWAEKYGISHVFMLVCLSFGFLRIPEAEEQCSVETALVRMSHCTTNSPGLLEIIGPRGWLLVTGLESHHPFLRLLPKRYRVLNSSF